MADTTCAAVCSVYAARASCAEPEPPVSCTAPTSTSSSGHARSTSPFSPAAKQVRFSRRENASAAIMSPTTSGASTKTRSLTTATAFSSRAKLGVEALRSTNTVPGRAAWTNPRSSK